MTEPSLSHTRGPVGGVGGFAITMRATRASGKRAGGSPLLPWSWRSSASSDCSASRPGPHMPRERP